jgi:hypothetical protein
MKKLILILFALLLSLSSKSQDLELLLLAKNDANLLMKNYMSPIMNGMMNGLNNGWNHTAKTHKKFGFDITINANAAIVPSSDKSFIFNPADYQYLTLQNPTDNKMSTVMGSINNSQINIKIPANGNTYKVEDFKLPNGIGDDLPLNAVPSPMIQASIGLPTSTDISIRFLPRINTDDVKANLIGFGIKHNLMQYFGPLDKLPLNVSVFGGFTTMNTTYAINSTELPGSNQEATFKLNTYTVQALASLDFPVITLYGGIGYDNGTSDLKINGTYNLTYKIEGTANTITETVTNPLNLDFKTSGFRGTLGTRLNLAFFKIFVDYTIKDYNTLSAGIAFSFR